MGAVSYTHLDVYKRQQWESVECRYGIAELDVYKSKPFVYYVKVFKSLSNNIQHYTCLLYTSRCV